MNIGPVRIVGLIGEPEDSETPLALSIKFDSQRQGLEQRAVGAMA
jgi:hypothetical protein